MTNKQLVEAILELESCEELKINYDIYQDFLKILNEPHNDYKKALNDWLDHIFKTENHYYMTTAKNFRKNWFMPILRSLTYTTYYTRKNKKIKTCFNNGFIESMNNKVKLKSYFVALASGLKPMATLSVEIDGQVYEESSSGDGQYDAFVRALRKIYKVTLGRKFPMLINYAVSIPPGGRTDAFVQTVITWSFGEKVFRTRGLDADQTEAAIKATIKMLNIIEEY